LPTVSLLLQALFTKGSGGEQLVVLLPSSLGELACQLLLQALFTKSSHGE
jgi:hypothetical protein